MRDFWLRSPMYIVICVLLGFAIAFLAAQNSILKGELQEIKQTQADAQASADDVKQGTEQIKRYLRCVSLTPVENRTPELIEKCFSDDLPPQPNTNKQSSTGNNSTIFLAPGPSNGTTTQPSQPVDNSPGNSGQTPGGNQTVNPQPQGLIPSLCTNVTPRACATLGL